MTRSIPDALVKSPAHIFNVTPPVLTAWIAHLIPRDEIIAKYSDMDTVFAMFDRALETFQERGRDDESYQFVMTQSEAIAFYNAIEDFNDSLLVKASS